MSLVVKGISLPRSCSTCRFSYFTVGIKKRCEISGDEVNPLIDHRDINCPLSEIPTPHGDLIDKESIKKFILDGINKPSPESYGYDGIEILSEIEFAPVIIEAEVSE